MHTQGKTIQLMLLKNEKRHIKELKSGSREAFNLLYEYYSPQLYSYSLHWTKSHEKSEGIVQNVFMKLWLKRSTIKNEESISHFLFTTAKFQLINTYRKNVHSPIFEEYTQYKDEIKLSVNKTDDPINYDEFCEIIEKIKRTLPPTQQKVFDYSIFQQLNIAEIAEKMNLNKQTVRNQLSLALKVFRKELDKNAWLLLLIIINQL